MNGRPSQSGICKLTYCLQLTSRKINRRQNNAYLMAPETVFRAKKMEMFIRSAGRVSHLSLKTQLEIKMKKGGAGA